MTVAVSSFNGTVEGRRYYSRSNQNTDASIQSVHDDVEKSFVKAKRFVVVGSDITFVPGPHHYVTNNIIGLSIFSGLDRGYSDSNKAIEAKRITTAENNIFFLNKTYLNGFLATSYKETTNVDPNSPANTFRQAMGMKMTGTIKSSSSMFANRYPWKEALKFFGAMNGYGSQKSNNH